MQFITIQDEDSLASYCFQAKNAPYLAVDTEFVRTRTLFPKLGLIQIFDGRQLALIDPLLINDLSPFWQLLSDPDVLKLLHACSEDVEVFLTQANCKPQNLLDTQIAMSFLGHGLSLGYAAMVKHFSDIELDKSESRTDWLQRPLSTRQLDYAAADVFHLWHIGEKICQALSQSPWRQAAFDESAQLINKKFRPVKIQDLYKDVKGAWKLKPRQLSRLKALCEWRYEQAVKRDLPISFIAKDATLLLLSEHNPKSVGAMAACKEIDILDVRHQGKAMLAILRHCKDIEEELLPKPICRLDEQPGYKQLFKQLKHRVAEAAQESGLTAEFIASKKQINHFLANQWLLNVSADSEIEPDVFIGWRQELVGNALLEILQQSSRHK